MKTSLQNCLKAVRKIEGKKLEDELGEGCVLRFKVNVETYTHLFKKNTTVIHGSYEWHTNGLWELEDLKKNTEILGNPNNLLQRVLGALNKKLKELEGMCEQAKIYMAIDNIAHGEDWNHSKDIQEDSTYDKITELLI